MRCKNCGKAVRDDSRFCPYCGDDLTADSGDREIYSNSAEKRIDDECYRIENENRKNSMPDGYSPEEYYTDGYSSGVNEPDDRLQTRVFNPVNNPGAGGYAPFAPDDIDEYGNEKKKKHSKLFVTLIICGMIIITAAVVAAAVIFGKSCSQDADVPAQSTGISEPSAPTTATAEQVAVPGVVGLTEEEAINALEKYGFKVSKITQNSETVEYGYVIAQNPGHGEAADKGSVVTLSVSLGSEETEPEAVTESETEAPTKSAEKTISTYILPESADRYLDYADLEGLSDNELVLARNEIYARHGRLFDSRELQDYFDKCSWYNGTVSPQDFDESVLNKYERANIDFILQKEYSSAGNL